MFIPSASQPTLRTTSIVSEIITIVLIFHAFYNRSLTFVKISIIRVGEDLRKVCDRNYSSDVLPKLGIL